MVRLHPHARERMQERGATEEEIQATVAQGEQFPAKLGALAFDATFSLPRNGADGVIAPSKLKPTPFRKAPTGWSSRSSHATFEP